MVRRVQKRSDECTPDALSPMLRQDENTLDVPCPAASIIEVRHAVEDDQPRHTDEIITSLGHAGDE